MSEHCGCQPNCKLEGLEVQAWVESSTCRYPAALADRDTWKGKYTTLLDKSRGFPAARYAALSDYAEKFGYKPILSSQTPEGVVMDSLDAAMEAIWRLRDVLNGIIKNDEHVKTCPCSTCKAFQETEQWEVK